MSPAEILAMPECLLLSYHANLDRLRAERLLDGAQAATVPHLSKDGNRSWYQAVQKRARRPVLAEPTAPGAVGSTGALFTINGTPTDKHGLARWLAATFGLIPGSPIQPTQTNGHGSLNGNSHGAVR